MLLINLQGVQELLTLLEGPWLVNEDGTTA